MQKEECIEIVERYIHNQTDQNNVKRLKLRIKNNQEISSWLEQEITASSSTIDNDVQTRMFRNIENKIDIKDRTDSEKQNRFQLNKWIRVAAIFILPLLTAAGTYFYMSRNETTPAQLVVAVERGQKANITLPDGSKVWLNSQSKLTYSTNFNVKKRELQLDGEAYFEVTHNPSKPFIVRSNDISVKALGTAFGVKAYNEDKLISSILMKGKVLVTTPDGEAILMPNERIMYDKTTHKKVQSTVTNATDFTGWIHNELRFEDESLGDIAKTIQRIYNVEVLFASERLKSQRYTGTINNNSLESVLNIISLTSPVAFQINNQQVTLSENNKPKQNTLLRH
jgi:transmembrane sensor